MGFDIAKFFSADYLFDLNPGGDFLFGYFLLVFFIMLLFSSSIMQSFAPKSKYFRKSMKKKFGKFIALGIIGIIFVVSRFSVVPYFSMRALVYVVFLLSILLLVLTLLKIRKEYKQRLASVAREKINHGKRIN